mgnify:CR=1 FL=1
MTYLFVAECASDPGKRSGQVIANFVTQTVDHKSQGPEPPQRMELKILAWLLASCLFSHLSLSLEVEDVPNTEVWLTPVDPAAEGRKTNALTVGAGALGAGAGLAWLYNKYKNKNPGYGSSYGSTPSYYQGPSYSTSNTYSRPSYSRPSYSGPSYSRPSYTSSYRPAVVHRPTIVHRPTVIGRPAVVHKPVVVPPKPSPVNPTSIPALVPTNIQNPLYQFNGTHFVLAAGGAESRKLANYLSAVAGLGGGALLYNKYQQYKNRPYRPNYGYTSRPSYAISQPHYSSYGQGSYISHSQTYGNGYPSGYFQVRRS